MGIVSTILEKCRRCYTCVRECPAKAIKVENGQATVIENRCIACGNCVKVCAQQAKHIEDSTDDVRKMLSDKERTFACLAPSFPAAFHLLRPGQIVSALRALGFDEVWEVALGAELVGREYRRLFDEARRTGACVIASPCPAIVSYIEKYMPALQGVLAPIVSPMVAVARAIRQRHGAKARIVFIGPCIAKKHEFRAPAVEGDVNAVVTFRELARLFEDAGIHPESLADGRFDNPRCRMGGAFPISGGLLRTSGLSTDILDNEIIVTEGKDRVLDALHEAAGGRGQARFFDVLFCEGCISGPKMLNALSIIARKEILANALRERAAEVTPEESEAALSEFAQLDLRRVFHPENQQLPQPDNTEILGALRLMRKFTPEDHLDCGACGYPTCREKAIAICQGLAEPEMCLPYLVEELQDTCTRLETSHRELASAQQRLVQSERLASMGQLSAGVAHEINNPLGTILIYSHMLLKQMTENPHREDLAMIVSEATRCKNIVRGLLDFARQSRVSREPADLAALIVETRAIVATRATAAGVTVQTEVSALPRMMLDPTQVRQMLVNLVENGIDATPSGGRVRVRAHLQEGAQEVKIQVEDTGSGMSREHMSKLFTPFFTTKEMGKGTGLGLAIVYGIVKMHSGDITVDSVEGKGSCFTIALPVDAGTPRTEAGGVK